MGGNIDIVVELVVATALDDTDLQKDSWSIALDQRALGPRRIIVAFAERSGRFLRLAHTSRIEPMLLPLACCLDLGGMGAEAAVVFCDEPVSSGPPPADLDSKFADARELFKAHGVHLVDWFSCDDQLFRSTRLALDPRGEWWTVP